MIPRNVFHQQRDGIIEIEFVYLRAGPGFFFGDIRQDGLVGFFDRFTRRGL
jgi:hypothetical protein